MNPVTGQAWSLGRNTIKIMEHKLVSFAAVRGFIIMYSCNFNSKADWHTSKAEIHRRQKLG